MKMASFMDVSKDVVMNIAALLSPRDRMNLASCNRTLWSYAEDAEWRRTDRVEVTLGGTTSCRSMCNTLSRGRFAQPDTLVIGISNAAMRSVSFPGVIRRVWRHMDVKALELKVLDGGCLHANLEPGNLQGLRLTGCLDVTFCAPVTTLTSLSLDGTARRGCYAGMLAMTPHLEHLSINSALPADVDIWDEAEALGIPLARMDRLRTVHLRRVHNFPLGALPASVTELKYRSRWEDGHYVTMSQDDWPLNLTLERLPRLERLHLEHVEWVASDRDELELQQGLVNRQLRGLTMLNSFLACDEHITLLDTSAMTRLTSLHVLEDSYPCIGLDRLPTALLELTLDYKHYQPHEHWLGPPGGERDGEPCSLDLAPLTALTHLGLRNTDLHGDVHQFGLLPLKSLDLTGSMTDVEWAWVGGLTRLCIVGAVLNDGDTPAEIRNALPCIRELIHM